MSRSSPYPGFYGVLGIGETPVLTPRERHSLLEDVWDIIAGAADPSIFFSDLVECVHRLRDLIKLDHERTAVGRRDNLDAVLKAKRRGRPPPPLSQINRFHFARLRERRPESSDTDLLLSIRSDIPQATRGRDPSDALRYGGAFLLQVYQTHLPGRPSARVGGPYNRLLQAVASAATGKPHENLHSAAEEALKMHALQEGPGVSTIIRERFRKSLL